MISSWLLKVVLGIALVGLIVVEVGSPLIARAQGDDAAHAVADRAALELFSSRNIDAARKVAEEEAVKSNVTLDEFRVDEQGVIHVRVIKMARSFVMKNIEATKKFYSVEVEASATPERIR